MVSPEFVAFFTQLFVITFGVAAGFLISFKLLWPKVEAYMLRLQALRQNRYGSKAFQQLRFAAYERLLLLVHRMDPKEVMLRNHDESNPVQVFVRRLTQDIESEYQHNLAQQLYVSDAAWHYVSKLKEDTLQLLRHAAAAIPEESPLDHYIAAVLQHVSELEENPHQAAQKLLKKELSR